MKQLLLLGGLLLGAGRCWGQAVPVTISEGTSGTGEEFVGVWKVKAKCVESLCNNLVDSETRSGSLTAQTWTISQDGQLFTLTSDNKAIAVLKNGRFNGTYLIFEGSNTWYGPKFTTAYGQRIMLKVSGTSLSGTQMMGREQGSPVCMWRYTIAGTQ